MNEKKTWIRPTLELLNSGYVEGSNYDAHEKTGHPSTRTPNVHVNGGPFVGFFNGNDTKAVANFTNAASS